MTNRKGSKKMLFVFTIVFIISLITNSFANAYQFTGNKWPKKSGLTYTVDLRYGMPSLPSYDIYRAAFDYGVSQWNSAQSKIRFNLSSTNTSTPFYVGTENILSLEHFGTCYCYGSMSSDFVFTTVEILVNMGNANVSTKLNTRRGVAGHELGHALGLHEENSVSNALMNQERNRETVYVPKPDDINGVNARYPN